MTLIYFIGFHTVLGLQIKCQISTVQEKIGNYIKINVLRNVRQETNQGWHMLAIVLLTLWRHRMCDAKCRSLWCQMLQKTITTPTITQFSVAYQSIFTGAEQMHMEVLTERTTSLASSALHLKGLSWQETFLLNKKKILVFFTCSMYCIQGDNIRMSHLQQLTRQFLHYSYASALVPSSAHGWI